MENTTDTPRNSTWSISPEKTPPTPVLTSPACYDALVRFFQDESSPFVLPVATESSSHVSGLDSLFAQPWVYAGGGLGNIDECPLQVCLAGGTKRDSLTFASVCVVPECDAVDLSAGDFPERLKSASLAVERSSNQDIVQEYVTLNERIAQVNKFLGTGWVCGNYKVNWQPIPSVIFLFAVCGCLGLSFFGTFYFSNRKKGKSLQRNAEEIPEYCEEKKDSFEDELVTKHVYTTVHAKYDSSLPVTKRDRSFWSAWDLTQHIDRLCIQRPDTACLDGLKVLSLLWVVAGHVMAIQSSSGPGYLNPSSFLPPSGITTTFAGQLLFSSRFAVDTFLCISGFLVVYVLKNKLSASFTSVFFVLLFRVLRILPLYLMCLGFWMYAAPHLGSGPFWYQWQNFLLPCRQYWWTNLLFVNNFLPWGQPTTNTCFYHSWYLAVDVQLFFLFAPWLVLLHKNSKGAALLTAFLLWSLSVAVTAILTYQRNWSVNTFDGISVALFDVEGYAKPHIRAQSYLAGMVVAMLPRMSPGNSCRDAWSISIAVFCLVILSHITVTGAYARRPCNFEESPLVNDCGSLWPEEITLFYTAFSRALWSVCISTIIYLCVQRRGVVVGKVLSWRIWTPLAHLSFGAYLIHPIIIFVWQLGGKEKRTFRILSFIMDFTAISVVSFTTSAFVCLVVEFPFGELLRLTEARHRHSGHQSSELVPLTRLPGAYGTLSGNVCHLHRR